MICSQLIRGINNPFEVVVYHLLSKWMIGIGRWDEILMVSALICMVTPYTRLMVSHDIRLLSSYDFTKILYCIVSQP